jgi:hypothetical protein
MEQLQRENRIVYQNFPDDWDKYRMSYLVYKSDETSAEDSYAGDNYIKNRLYSFPRYQIRLLRSFLDLKKGYPFYSLYRMNKALKRNWMNSHYYDRNVATR